MAIGIRCARTRRSIPLFASSRSKVVGTWRSIIGASGASDARTDRTMVDSSTAGGPTGAVTGGFRGAAQAAARAATAAIIVRRPVTTRIRFLPTFFTLLTIAFVVLVAARLRSHRHADAVAPVQPAAAVNPPAAGAESHSPQPDGKAEAGGQRSEVRSTPDRVRVRPALPVIKDPEPEPLLSTLQPRSAPRPAPKPSPSPASPQTSKPRRVPAPTSVAPVAAGGIAPSTSTVESTRPAEPVEEKDPSSDTSPPQLVSVEFNPPVIRDGEYTQLFVAATDDLSGVRSISGTITSPSGALTGFSLQRGADGVRHQGRVDVPADAADGVWKITFMSLTDAASNAVYLNQGVLPPSASFKVTSSRPDTEAPVLKAIWVDRVALRGGERTTINVQVEDEQTGVKLVSGVFHSPAKFARLGFGCQQRGDTWQGQLIAPACLDCGDWQLEQIQLQDKANNTTTIRMDNPLVAAVRVNILSDQCDSTPPVVQSVVFDTTVVSNVADSKVGITIIASDNFCGVESVSGYVVPDGGPAQTREPFNLRPTADPNTWRGEVTIRRLAAKGIWKINWLQVVDKGKNLRGLSANEPALAGAVFRVQ
jgi:hypothetical protein